MMIGKDVMSLKEKRKIHKKRARYMKAHPDKEFLLLYKISERDIREALKGSIN